MRWNSWSKFLQWWQGGPIPRIHIFIPKEKQPHGLYSAVRIYFRKWVVHPIKRRAAKYYLAFLKKFFGLKVIAITGSVGKTTTKEMLLSVLSQKYKVVATEANIDPIYNIPTTILKARPGTQFLILEMGVEFPGEINFYLWLAQPDSAILTTLNITHTEFFGDARGVAEEKIKLIKAVKSQGAVFLNRDDKNVLKYAKNLKAKIVFYSLGEARGIRFTKDLETEFKLGSNRETVDVKIPLLGEQIVSNAMCAAAVGRYYGVPLDGIKRGLEGFSIPPHRMRPLKTKSGAWVIDDAYNNNPLGLEKALKTLSKVPAKRRIAVLSYMAELGKLEEESHREGGRLAGELKITEVIGFGDPSKFLIEEAKQNGVKKAWLADSKKKIIDYLKSQIKSGDVILVKGSRYSGKMEEVVVELIR